VNYLLDTNVVSESRRKRPDSRVVSWLRWADVNTLHISVLTLGEMAKGIAQREIKDRAQAAIYFQWLDAVRSDFADRTIGIDPHIAEAWGRLAAERPLPIIDGLLAATALVHGMTLVTRDTRDVADTGVATINPWTA
jgi:predicted nucleic acid-binding protein